MKTFQGRLVAHRVPGGMLTPVALALLAVFPMAAQAAPAARVEFAFGGATATAPGAAARPLSRGTELAEGDTILTGDGRVQLRFTDGAFVSLKPGSEFRIDQYRYAGKPDGDEKGFFSLLKGGLRTVTGFIGKSNHQAYQLSTTVATIGIRGTAYTADYVPGTGGAQTVSGDVADGGIVVCGTGGCQTFSTGDAYVINGLDQTPKHRARPPQVNTPPSANNTYSSTNDTTSTGGNATLGGNEFTGTRDLTSAYYDGSSLQVPGSQPGQVTFVSRAVSMIVSPGTVTFSAPALVGGVPAVGNDGILAWGTTQSPSTGEYRHYTAGTPVQVDSTTGGGRRFLNFTLISGVVSWTTNYPSASHSGVVPITNGGTVVLDTLNTSLNISGLQLSLPGQVLTLSSASPTSLQISAGGSRFSDSLNCSSSGVGSCSFAAVGGVVAGAKAERLGLIFIGSSSPDDGTHTTSFGGSAGYRSTAGLAGGSIAGGGSAVPGLRVQGASAARAALAPLGPVSLRR